MDFYSVSPLPVFIVFLALAIIVWIKGTKTSGSRAGFGFLICLAFYALCAFGERNSASVEHAFYWHKGLMVFLSGAAFFFWRFVSLKTHWRGKGALTVVFACLVTTVIVLTPTRLLVQGVGTDLFGYVPIPGVLFPFQVAAVYMPFLAGLGMLISAERILNTYEERNRLLVILIGVIIAMAAGFLDVLSIVGLTIFPVGMFGHLVLGIFFTVAIVKYKLFDVEIVVRKGTAYILMSALVAIPYVGIIVGASRALGGFPSWSYVLLLVVLALGLQPLWKRLQDWVERKFYRHRYEYIRELQDFTQRMTELSEVRELANPLLQRLAPALGTDKAYLFLSSHTGDFHLVASTKSNNHSHEAYLSKDSPLIHFFEHHQQSLLHSYDFNTVPQLQSLTVWEKALLFEEMESDLFIALRAKQQLIGILILGLKSGHHPYSMDDMQILSSTVPQLAISLDNARLYQQEKERVSELYALEEKHRTLVEDLNVGVFRVTPELEGRFIEVNPALVQICGYRSEQELGNVMMLDLFDDPEQAKGLHEELMTHGAIKGKEVRLKRQGDTPFWGRITATLIRDEDGTPTYYQGVLEDVTEWKQAQDKIKASLEEKETLLREIHHRVKNNLQIVSSLLRRQGRQIQDETLKQSLRESENRVLSMSLIHEKLYRSKNLAAINFQEFINGIARSLSMSYGLANVRITRDIEDIHLPIDTAVPCGLIVNELISNALKHAFPEGKGGEIKIGLHRTSDSEVELMVRDNGIGLPEQIDIRNTDSLGMDLITVLSEKQLDGKIDLNRDQGTEFRIRFPLPQRQATL